jgi:hypothetical protein
MENIMKDNRAFRTMALALLLSASGPAFPSSAQERAGVRPPPPPRSIQLPCCRCVDGKKTSINVSTGAVPWNVAFGTGTPQSAGLVSNVSWTPVPPGKWIGPGSEVPGNYTYQMPFQVPNCVIPMQVTISGQFAADNTASLYVDTNFVKSLQGTPNYGFLPGSVTPFNWSGTLAPGTHNIKVVVTNSDGPTGLVVAATLTIICPHENGTENPTDPR